MRITTLGTSHGDATYCRFNSSILFELAEGSYLIDAGAPVNALMIRKGKRITSLKAVFVTHMHDDHVGGLPGLVKSLIKYPQPGQHTDVFLPEARGIPALREWLAAQHLQAPPQLIAFHTIRPGPLYEDAAMAVAAVGTRHLESADGPITFAYLLAAEGKRVLCSGDLSGDFSDFPALAQEEAIDLCLCEATHYEPYLARPVLKTSRLKRLIFTHIHNPWHGEGEETLKALYEELPYPYEVAHDGDEFLL